MPIQKSIRTYTGRTTEPENIAWLSSFTAFGFSRSHAPAWEKETVLKRRVVRVKAGRLSRNNRGLPIVLGLN